MLSRLSDRNRRRLRTTLTILVTALLVAPAAALATHGFDDVRDGDFYHAAVDWMKANGVTAGCNPPDNTEYCPEDPVTRGEMAVFLERLDTQDVFLRPGDVSTSDGGGDADTLDGKHASDFLGASEKAADSNKLDGKDASAFFQVGDSIDADTLDGKDASAFLPASGQIRLSVLDYRSHIEGNLETRAYSFGPQVLPGTSNDGFVTAYPSIPQSILGSSLELVAWEYCYETNGSSTLRLARVQVRTGDASGTSPARQRGDSTDRTDDACRTLTLSSPIELTDSTFVSLQFNPDVTDGTFEINRSVLIFQAP